MKQVKDSELELNPAEVNYLGSTPSLLIQPLPPVRHEKMPAATPLSMVPLLESR